MEEAWERLDRWQNNIDQNMTKDKYLAMCVQLEQDPDPDKMPPDIEDLPRDMQKAVYIFNKLGDRVVQDVGYVGKDYTALPLHMRVAGIKNEELFLETLLRLDNKLIEKMAAKMKAERERARAKR